MKYLLLSLCLLSVYAGAMDPKLKEKLAFNQVLSLGTQEGKEKSTADQQAWTDNVLRAYIQDLEVVQKHGYVSGVINTIFVTSPIIIASVALNVYFYKHQ